MQTIIRLIFYCMRNGLSKQLGFEGREYIESGRFWLCPLVRFHVHTRKALMWNTVRLRLLSIYLPFPAACLLVPDCSLPALK